MVRQKTNSSPVKNNDLAKVRFRPGKFKIIRTIKTYPLKAPIQVPLKEPVEITLCEMASTSQSMETSTNAPVTETGLKSALILNVPVTNKFAVLANQDGNETQQPTANKPNTNKDRNDKVKVAKPPPIVLHYKIKSASEFIGKLQNDVKKGFHIKNTKNNTNVFIHDLEEYRNYLGELEKESIDFHTYTEKGKKTHAFLLRGIDGDITSEEIKQSIEESYSIKVLNVYQLRNTTRNNYMVITDNSIFLRFLNTNVKYVCYTKITWERFHNRSPVIQCRRCQQWGHSTANCRSQATCTKCSDKHWTKDCTKVKKDEETTHQNIKCANCQGNHLAFSKNCPVYQKRIERMETKKQQSSPSTKKQNFIPAPLPTTNPWLNNRGGRFNDVSRVPPPPEKVDTQTNFNSLVSEFNMLNQLVDLEKMVRLVRELNMQLRGCTSDLEKFLKFSKFCQTQFKATETEINQCLP